MKLLIIDCCIRGEHSRTGKLLEAFQEGLLEAAETAEIPPETERLRLMDLDLQYLSGGYFEEREALLAEGRRDHPRFRYAHQFAGADKVVIAAPFWDLGIPALLKVYIENISVDGITFGCDADGMFGKCRASEMVFFTTRGSAAGGSEDEQGARYLQALCRMYGIPGFRCICAEGLDAAGSDVAELMSEAVQTAKRAGELFLDM